MNAIRKDNNIDIGICGSEILGSYSTAYGLVKWVAHWKSTIFLSFLEEIFYKIFIQQNLNNWDGENMKFAGKDFKLKNWSEKHNYNNNK